MGPTAIQPEANIIANSLGVKRHRSPASQIPYEIREEPIHTRRPIRVICLGAGYSGILMGIVWNQRMQNRNADFVIYERNNDLGGTWLENRSKALVPA